MRKINWFVFILTILGMFLLIPGKILASIKCEKQYAGEVCIPMGELLIDKVVWDPENQRFVDNLEFTDHKFSSQEEVVFQLRIKNIGDATIPKVEVKDTLPFFLELTDGSLSFEITDLTAGETEMREIKTKVIEKDKLSQEVVCDTNVAEAFAGELHDKDTVKVCAIREKLPVKILPPTGFGGFFWLVNLCLFLTGVGIFLLIVSRRRLP